jgi:hypothetical protein
MLQGAAAAAAEKRRDRYDTIGARLVDVEELPPVGMPRARLDRHRLAGQGVGHIDRTCRRVGNSIAAMRKSVDFKPFTHAFA